MPPKEHIRFVPPPPAQALAELKNLIARAKPDFKGHLGPKLVVKKADDIKKEHDAKVKMLPDGERFRDFFHPRQPLAAEATKTTKVRPSSAQPRPSSADGPLSYRDPRHPNYNIYKQQLDEKTGKPLLETVLHWDESREQEKISSGKLLHDGKRTGRKAFAEKYDSNLQREAANPTTKISHATRQDVEDLTPRHRTALIRTLSFAHPKFTQSSVVHHSTTQWNEMSQLLRHAYADERPKPPRSASQTKTPRRSESARVRNSVRMVALMREAQGRHQRAWH